MKYFLFVVLCVSISLVRAQTQTGQASFYADAFEGRPTASGEKYRANKLTAAHKTLPFGTVVKVTNLANNESVEVTINDRGPFVEGRIIDLSKAAAERLKFLKQGTADVKVEIVDGGNGKSQTAVVDQADVVENEFYDFEINRVMPKGFGVQIGTYQELANLFRITDTLKKTYKKKAVVQVKVVKGVKYYSLILGPFSSHDKARGFASDIRKQFPDSFVLDYSRP